MLPDENLIIKAIDATKINTWEEFEFVLSIVVENRFMRLFQAHLDAQYQLSWRETKEETLNLQEQKSPEKLTAKKKRKCRKKLTKG